MVSKYLPLQYTNILFTSGGRGYVFRLEPRIELWLIWQKECRRSSILEFLSPGIKNNVKVPSSSSLMELWYHAEIQATLKIEKPMYRSSGWRGITCEEELILLLDILGKPFEREAGSTGKKSFICLQYSRTWYFGSCLYFKWKKKVTPFNKGRRMRKIQG